MVKTAIFSQTTALETPVFGCGQTTTCTQPEGQPILMRISAFGGNLVKIGTKFGQFSKNPLDSPGIDFFSKNTGKTDDFHFWL